MRVLICDDTEVIRKTMRMFLEKDGHEVVADCSCGEEAIERYKLERPDVCLLDIAMPGMDGMTTMREIKSFAPDVRVIMCTAKDDQKSIDQAKELGVIDFVEKPFSPSRLREAMAKVIL